MSQSPYITTRELAELTRKDQTKHPLINAWKWAKRNRLPRVGNGRSLWLRASAIEALEDEAKQRTARRRRSA